METLREIRRRIRSIGNLVQVTHALEAVSASKVQKAQAAVLETRPYAHRAWEVIVNLSGSSEAPAHPLLTRRESIKSVLIILFTSDRAGNADIWILDTAETDAWDSRYGTFVERPLRLGSYPNPFDRATTIHFELGHSSHVSLSLFDLTGALVKRLCPLMLREAGSHAVVWDGTDTRSRRVKPGRYACVIRVGGYSEKRSIVLTR